MRLIVFSDSHGREERLEKILAAQPCADYYIFLGDGAADAQRLRERHPDISLLTVRGNCDYGCEDAAQGLLEVNGRRVLYTHGHRYGVKMSMEPLMQAAKETGADVVLYGHTHVQNCAVYGGVYYLNPGSAALYSGAQFAIVDIAADGAILCAPTALR